MKSIAAAVLAVSIGSGALAQEGKSPPDVLLATSPQAVPVAEEEFFEVTVDAQGGLWVAGEAMTQERLTAALRSWRAEVRPSDEEGGFCAHPLRIRADQRAPARHVQGLMQLAGHEDLKVYKIQWLTADGEKDGSPTAVKVFLPKDFGVRSVEPVEAVEVRVKRLVAADGPDWQFSEKQLQLSVGPVRLVDLPSLQKTLEKARAGNPKAQVLLYPDPSSLSVDLLQVVACCQRAGFPLPGIAGAPNRRR